jgi:integrase/recombinase XerD
MTIRKAVEQYIGHKRSLGMKFDHVAMILHSFARRTGEIDLDELDAPAVHAFLFSGNVAPQTAHDRCSALRGFYRFAITRKLVSVSPLPLRMPKISNRLIPYIYSDEEMQGLIRAVGLLSPSKLQPHTMQTILTLLYGAGLRISEAVNLINADVDLVTGILNIRMSKFYKDRLVPVSRNVAFTLRNYCSTRRCLGHSDSVDAPLLVDDDGKPITVHLADQVFRRLCVVAQVRRGDGGRYQPRLHDMRHSFAVRRLIAWYKDGADVNVQLPRLSTYLGHFQLSHTQRYLTMTPELLQQANARFEAFVQPEVSDDKPR